MGQEQFEVNTDNYTKNNCYHKWDKVNKKNGLTSFFFRREYRDGRYGKI